ncbi:MAG: glutamate--tRNA ligase family protein [Verrucomicrobiota bacterium]
MATRFAPSLTGYLHLGHVLHMIHVWGVARARGAEVLARIEDHDRARSRPEYEASVLENMEWLGFVPDRGIGTATAGQPSEYRQSDCADHYAVVLQTLAERGLVYGCECSRREILAKQSDGQGELCYPGTCEEKNLPLDGNTVRFRIPSGTVAFRDLALGECHQAPVGQCGDFSLRDRQGQWTYQFCCVCDDIRHGVGLVVRGEDILSSTGRQIRLFQALESAPPTYFHHPLVCDDAGEKLSKRQRSESIDQLRDAGVSADEIIGRAAFAGGLIPEFRPLSAADAALLLE